MDVDLRATWETPARRRRLILWVAFGGGENWALRALCFPIALGDRDPPRLVVSRLDMTRVTIWLEIIGRWENALAYER